MFTPGLTQRGQDNPLRCVCPPPVPVMSDRFLVGLGVVVAVLIMLAALALWWTRRSAGSAPAQPTLGQHHGPRGQS